MSTTWNSLDTKTQNRIKGTGNLIGISVSGAAVTKAFSGVKMLRQNHKSPQHLVKTTKDLTAKLPASSINLNRKLRALENAQKNSYRTNKLPDGRIRYYKKEKRAIKKGETRGASLVTEYDPKNGKVRQWMESYNHKGDVIRVHPKNINAESINSPHYPPTGKELLK